MTEDEMVGWHHRLREVVMDREDCVLHFMGLQRVGQE